MPIGVYKRTEQTKSNISKGHIGQVAWNKGIKTGQIPWNKNKPLSVDQKNKISESVLNSKKFIKYWDEHIYITKEEIKEKRKKYYKNNKDKVKKWKRDDYIRRRDKYIEKSSLHYKENCEYKKNYSREYQQKNIEKVLEKLKIWSKKNPDKIRSYSENRRASKKVGGGKVSGSDIKNQYLLQGGLCYWCEKPVNDKYHLDHLIPLSKGGLHSICNIVISCPKCNLTKNNKMPNEFRKFQSSKGSAEKDIALRKKDEETI